MSDLINSLSNLHNRFFEALENATQGWLLGLAARFVFAATLLVYFWNSAKTKLGDGILGFLAPSDGAYIQVLPKAFENAGYDSSALGLHHDVIVILGTWAEFILPLLIILGLLTRLSSLAFIGFVAVMTIVDITGHSVDATTIGSWFDGDASSLISDQRMFWVLLLLILVVKGGGKLSVDHFLNRRREGY